MRNGSTHICPPQIYKAHPMSYYDNQFTSGPSVQQHGSHMVMKNVNKTIKERIVNIDTKYRTDYDYLDSANVNIVLGERLSEVMSLEVVSVDLPITYYNIHGDLFLGANDANNVIKFVKASDSSIKTITLTPNYYATASALSTEVNTQLANSGWGVDISHSIVNNKSYLKSRTGTTYSVVTNVDYLGNAISSNSLNNLGWVLGFRDISYSITSTGVYSESIANVKTPRHLFLAINEYSQGNTNAFVSPQEFTNLNKNIIAKICIPNTVAFGDNLCANIKNGLIITESRKYLEKINIQRMNIQLLDDAGRVIHLNGADFSICLKVVHV
jgi:hypothetical protein